MNILRLSTLSLTFAIAVFALGYANPSFAGKPSCENNSTHPKCKNDEPTDGSVTYEAALEGAFVFDALDVDPSPHGNELKPDIKVNISQPVMSDFFRSTWENVFSMPDDSATLCNLFGVPGIVTGFEALSSAKKNKGWTIVGYGGVGVSFGFPLVTDDGADVNVGLSLIGNCDYAGGTDPCDPFLPDPAIDYSSDNARGPGISRIPLITFWIHAKAVKGTPALEGCHGAHTGLLFPSTLVIKATAAP